MREFIKIIESYGGGSSHRYRFVTDCTDQYMNGSHGGAIHDMVDRSEDIDYSDLEEAVGRDQLSEIFSPYDWSEEPTDLTLEDDFAVSYHKSVWRGIPCVYVRQSGIEYIFTLDGKSPDGEYQDPDADE